MRFGRLPVGGSANFCGVALDQATGNALIAARTPPRMTKTSVRPEKLAHPLLAPRCETNSPHCVRGSRQQYPADNTTLEPPKLTAACTLSSNASTGTGLGSASALWLPPLACCQRVRCRSMRPLTLSTLRLTLRSRWYNARPDASFGGGKSRLF